MSAAALRNENVPVYQIDNNAIKEANVRLGNSVSVVSDVAVDRTFFGAEFGQPASALVTPPQLVKRPSWHAEAFEWHQNGFFNARTFFQVGDVKPSRRNHYGGRFSTTLGNRAYLSGDVSQRKIRGMVNGNVLVPLASERAPRAADPAVYDKVARFLAAYPDELPNRPDFDVRALNTNAPQNVDQIAGSLRLDTDVTPGSRLSMVYSLSRMHEDAFQFVAGMNPDTGIHSHRAHVGYALAPDADTDINLGLIFQRTRTALTLEPNAVGPRIRIGYQIQDLGPDAEFPVNRALNTFRGGAHGSRRVDGGRHTLSFGVDLTRYQLNSEETRDQRGYFAFGNNFGRTGIENFLHGTPSFFEISLGYLPRGFRNWSSSAFVADRWQLHPRFQLYYGLRYSLLTRPVEVNGLDIVPFSCDCNNVSPRFGFAWQAGWGWVMRSSYGVSFSELQPVTYQQVRNNLPLIRDIQVQNPDLVNPLRGIDLAAPAGRTVPTMISPDLVSPYAHHYNFTLERKLARDTQMRFAYIGSRGVKMLNTYIMNRADPVPGIPLTLDTVDLRRPDPRYFETVQILNGGLAYFNAGQAGLETAPLRGLRTTFTYTFSKAIDEGVDYTATAANRDVVRGRSQWQYDNQVDKRGLSNFDSTHAMQFSYTYDLPRLAQPGGLPSRFLNGWQLAGAVLAKTGTPLTLYIGSDAPGFGNVDGGPSDRPNILDPSILGATISHPDIAPSIISRERFAYIRTGEHRGSVGRNTFRKANIGNWNASLNKMWQWGGAREWTLLLRAEAYNFTNTPQFDEPQRNLTSPSFGRITNTLNDGRVFQFGLQFVL
ncbi:MAG: hypothetical protein KIT09_33520 [Bryobacteraceae bacterium]|nr:hypothetical protein [Bryobacteraceae bacterium]